MDFEGISASILSQLRGHERWHFVHGRNGQYHAKFFIPPFCILLHFPWI